MINKFILFFAILVVSIVLYLSYFGVETKKFNQIIEEQINKKNKKINLELKTVKILLNLKKFSFNIKTLEPVVVYGNQKIELEEITTNLLLKNYFNRNFSIRDLKITTKEIKLKKIITAIMNDGFNPKLFLLDNIIKEGFATINTFLNFDEEGRIKNDYKINVSIKKTKIKLFNRKYINDLNFNIKIKNKYYFLSNLNFKYDELKFFSKKIEVTDDYKNYFVKGDLSNHTAKIDKNFMSEILKINISDLKNIKLNSENQFSFKMNKKFKISDIDLSSKIKVKSGKYNLNYIKLKNYFPNFDNFIEIKDHKINLIYKNNKLDIEGKGKISINTDNEAIEYKISKLGGAYAFKSKIIIKSNSFLIKPLNYKKKKNKSSDLFFQGSIDQNSNILFKNITYNESENFFIINELNLNKDLKINSIKNIALDFININKIKNNIKLEKKKLNYYITGKSFDSSYLINKILDSNNSSNKISFFKNFNTNIEINVDKVYVDENSYLNNLIGNFTFTKNSISQLDLESNFSNNRKLILTIVTNSNYEKVTTFFTDNPKPFVKRYKFIKGFEEGVLDFQSIKKNNISRSILNIDNFRVKEVPVLAKLLSLASLQGIADLLTGEGIRFTDFEMKFSNKDELMTIDEIYAIGPAISIMMSGYIESEKLISLRGTLVPARTINRTIASIPIIGKVLVGKKSGEGVFGVSFKIKGPPKDLKTSVNPIKTLTPRFITRTLEKIKKN